MPNSRAVRERRPPTITVCTAYRVCGFSALVWQAES